MKLICGQCGQEHEMSEERFRSQFQQDLDLIIKWGGEDSFRTWLSGYTESLTDENLLIVQSELDGDGLKVFHELTENRFSKVAYLNHHEPKQPPSKQELQDRRERKEVLLSEYANGYLRECIEIGAVIDCYDSFSDVDGDRLQGERIDDLIPGGHAESVRVRILEGTTKADALRLISKMHAWVSSMDDDGFDRWLKPIQQESEADLPF